MRTPQREASPAEVSGAEAEGLKRGATWGSDGRGPQRAGILREALRGRTQGNKCTTMEKVYQRNMPVYTLPRSPGRRFAPRIQND